MIFFEAVTDENFKSVHQIYPGDEGKYWVNFNWYWLELSKRRPGIQARFVSLGKHSGSIGFLAYGPHFSDRQLTKAVNNSCEMYHIVIDSQYQGQGLGKLATIHSLKEMVESSNCEQVLVACHPDNKTATQLYTKLGFVEVGKNYDGDPLYAITKAQILKMPTPSFPLKSAGINSRPDSWESESTASEKEFSWDAWEKDLET
jgi:diamine N-acetyltransferase